MKIKRTPAPSTVAIFQHPIHPMLVIYPIACLTGTLVCDLLFWWLGDAFWAQAAFWLAAAGAAMGGLAAIVGMIDFFTMAQVRQHVSAWSHFLAGASLVALATGNALLRLGDPVGAVLPWGLFLSAVIAPMVVVTGWLGGTLVYRHSIGAFGADIEEGGEPDEPPAE